uniref:Sfi1 spindle body domain-containing protein n=1 Tax=Spongospora subterranea TaxID=70186 RepID=A0A0H5RAN1_9EUKA|eukprot:CRZ11123.1 hypothetical protein [Spongospora subterranea]
MQEDRDHISPHSHLSYYISKWCRVVSSSKQSASKELSVSLSCNRYAIRRFFGLWREAIANRVRSRFVALSSWRHYVAQHQAIHHAVIWHSLSTLSRYWRLWISIRQQRYQARYRCLSRAWRAWSIFHTVYALRHGRKPKFSMSLARYPLKSVFRKWVRRLDSRRIQASAIRTWRDQTQITHKKSTDYRNIVYKSRYFQAVKALYYARRKDRLISAWKTWCTSRNLHVLQTQLSVRYADQCSRRLYLQRSLKHWLNCHFAKVELSRKSLQTAFQKLSDNHHRRRRLSSLSKIATSKYESDSKRMALIHWLDVYHRSLAVIHSNSTTMCKALNGWRHVTVSNGVCRREAFRLWRRHTLKVGSARRQELRRVFKCWRDGVQHNRASLLVASLFFRSRNLQKIWRSIRHLYLSMLFHRRFIVRRVLSSFRVWIDIQAERTHQIHLQRMSRILLPWYRVTVANSRACQSLKRQMLSQWRHIGRRKQLQRIICCREQFITWQEQTVNSSRLNNVAESIRCKRRSDMFNRWRQLWSWRQLKHWSLYYWSNNVQRKALNSWRRRFEWSRVKTHRVSVADKFRESFLLQRFLIGWIERCRLRMSCLAEISNAKRKEGSAPRPLPPEPSIDYDEEIRVLESLLENERRYRQGDCIPGYQSLSKAQIHALYHRIQCMMQSAALGNTPRPTI